MTQKTKYLGTTSALIMLLSVTVVQMDGSAFAMTSDYCQEIRSKIKSGELSEDEAKQLGKECNNNDDKNQKEVPTTESDREQRSGEKDNQTTRESKEGSDREQKTGEKSNKEEKIGIPDWVRNNAEWWAAGVINDKEFAGGIQYLVQQGIVKISDNVEQTTTLDDSEEIPTWVKNNAEWWSQHMISDDDFIKGIEYLVENGVIQV